MKKILLLVSLLFAATSAKGVYVEGATTDSSGVEAVVAAAELGEDQRRMLAQYKDPCNQGTLLHPNSDRAKDCKEEHPLDPDGLLTTWWCYICNFNFLPDAIYDAHCQRQCEHNIFG